MQRVSGQTTFVVASILASGLSIARALWGQGMNAHHAARHIAHSASASDWLAIGSWGNFVATDTTS